MKFGFFAYFDLFRLPIFLYFEGNAKRASIIGILCSFGIYAFLLYSFFQSDLFQKKSPLVVYQSNQIPHAERVEFTEKKLLVVAVGDAQNNRYMDESIFTVQFKYWTNATNVIYKTLLPCTLNDVEFNQSLYQTLGMEGSFCLQNKSFNLEGYWDEDVLSYVAINIFQCNNLTNGGKCKSIEEINAFFQDPLLPKFLALFYHDAQIDFYDFDNPFQITYQTYYQSVDPAFRKRVNLFFENGNVQTDDGLIFISNSVQSNIMFNTQDFDFLLRSSATDPYVQMLIYASKQKVMCTRSYQKLPEVLGSLTGIAHLIMFLCMMVAYLMTYISTLEFVLNRLYIFPEIKKKIKVKKLKTKKNKSKKKDGENAMTMKQDTLSPAIKEETKIDCEDLPHTKKNDFKNESENMKADIQNIPSKILKHDSFVLDHYSEDHDNFPSKMQKTTEMKETLTENKWDQQKVNKAESLKCESTISNIKKKKIQRNLCFFLYNLN